MVSVVIPVLDEREWLPRCLEALSGQAGVADAEVIVVDGGSRDGTRELAGGTIGVDLLEGPQGRGRQMNLGARHARGSLLVFLPADTLLPPGSLRTLAAIDRARSPAAGGFRQRFDNPGRVLRAVSILHNLRAAISGVFYGDQVPFVRKELFDRLGGYREGVDMEDVEFGTRLRHRTRSELLDLTVTTSARRFDRAGHLRATAEALRCLAWWVFLRKPPQCPTFFTPVR